jgi:hypothetical protein
MDIYYCPETVVSMLDEDFRNCGNPAMHPSTVMSLTGLVSHIRNPRHMARVWLQIGSVPH